MGQKSNPNALRTGTQKNWKTSSPKKKNSDIGLAVIRETAIKKHLNRIFNLHGMLIQDYRILNKENELNCFLSVYFMTDPKIKTKLTEKRFINQPSTLVLKTKKIENLLLFNSANNKNGNINFTFFKTLSKILQHYLGQDKKITFLINLANKQLLCPMNKKRTKLNLMSLRRYKREDFFTLGFDSLISISLNSDFISVLIEWFSKVIKEKIKIKRVLKFLKATLRLLVNDEQYSLTGVKIKVKGRLNGAARSKHFFINVGKVPIHTRKIKLDYAMKTIHNKAGSYGIKIWIVS